MLAADIARRCQSTLCHRLVDKSETFSLEQMRGYARAYAMDCLEPVLNQWITAEQPKPALICKVTAQAKEFLIEMVVREMQASSISVAADIAIAA